MSLTRQIIIAAVPASAADKEPLHVRLADAMEHYPTGPMSVATLEIASGISDTTIYNALDPRGNHTLFMEETADLIEAALGCEPYSIFYRENRTTIGGQPGQKSSGYTPQFHVRYDEVHCHGCFTLTRSDSEGNCRNCGDKLPSSETPALVG